MTAIPLAALLLLLFIIYRVCIVWLPPAFTAKDDVIIPPKVPAFLPWIGSAWAFTRDPLEFIQNCMHRFGACFTLTVMGREMTLLTSPILVAALHKSPAASRHEHLHAEMLPLIFGLSQAAADNAEVDRHAFPLIQHHLNWEHTRTLAPAFSKSLFGMISDSDTYRSPGSTTVSLRAFLSPMLYRGSCEALLGPAFPGAATYPDYKAFDEDFLLLASPLPWNGRSAKTARTHLLNAICGYVDDHVAPASKPPAKPTCSTSFVPPMVKDVYELLDSFAYNSKDVSSILLGLLVAFQSNVSLTAFWYLVNVLHDRETYCMLREEIRRGMAEVFNNSIDVLIQADPEHLDSERFPLLISGLNETFRTTTAQPIIRLMLDDIIVADPTGGPKGEEVSYLLKRGQAVYAFSRAVHMDDEIYDNPHTFRLHRFVMNEGKGIRTFSRRGKPVINHLMPWGGGTNQCSGRFYASHVIKVTVIMLFHLFDMEGLGAVDASGNPVGKTCALPRADEFRVGTVSSPDDYAVSFVRRSKEELQQTLIPV